MAIKAAYHTPIEAYGFELHYLTKVQLFFYMVPTLQKTYDCLLNHLGFSNHKLSMQNGKNHNLAAISVLTLLHVCMKNCKPNN